MNAIRADLAAELSLLSRLLREVHTTDTSGAYQRSIEERVLVAQACFVRLQIGLEAFLESAFCHYISDGASITGRKATKYASPLDAEHAQRMFIGLQRYMDWSTPERVRKLAEIYFDRGEPFASPLASAHSDLLDMKTIRNSAAHLSVSTSTALDALFSRKTGKHQQGVSPYDVVMAIDIATKATLFSGYVAIVSAVADQIAHW